MSDSTLDSVLAATETQAPFVDLTTLPPLVPTVTADFSQVQSSGMDTTASRQWASRPNDERYTSMASLDDFLTDRRIRSTVEQIKLSAINPTLFDDKLGFEVPGMSRPVEATHYAFGQLCTMLGAPASYLRRLPNRLTAECLSYGIERGLLSDDPQQALIEWKDDGPVLRAVTGENYGRVWDNQLSGFFREAAAKFGLEVPIAFHQAGMSRNPVVSQNVSKEDTTLYAGDRDSFIFLVDQNRPIEAGKLPNGEPRLLLRGLYAYNGETGARRFGVSTFLYSYICCNRMIWGQAGKQSYSRRHTKNAATDFNTIMLPAIETFLEGTSTGVEAGIKAAQAAKLMKDPVEQASYIATLFNIGLVTAKDILDTILAEEQHPAETAFDVIQGVTAYARSIPHADERVELETEVGKFFNNFVTA